jgi:hypothetical protein
MGGINLLETSWSFQAKGVIQSAKMAHKTIRSRRMAELTASLFRRKRV